MGILSTIAKKRGRAVLVVTQDPRLFQFADRIIHIEDGALTREDHASVGLENFASSAEILHHPHLEIARSG